MSCLVGDKGQISDMWLNLLHEAIPKVLPETDPLNFSALFHQPSSTISIIFVLKESLGVSILAI